MRIKALTLAFAVVLGLAGATQAHAANYRDLCSAVPGECEYTGPDAPVLAVDVCWSRSTSTSRLMTGATCPSGSYPYFVKYGIVDPLSLSVTGFVPLDDACSRSGLCKPSYLAPPTTWDAVMCCIEGVCWPDTGPCAGELLFCSNGVTNEDGTVECFDDQEV
ncbi:hypothetical protein ACNOYE_26510 [Nannocystaceae bacterium ST9]